MKRYWILITIAVCGLVALLGGLPATAQTAQRCFPETGQCISGRIREYWEQNGGLPVFGYPITPQQEQQIEGRALQVQWFQRNRLELHPENARPYDVLLGRLGVDRLVQQNRDWQTFPKSAAQNGCRFFPETGQNVCDQILAAWRANGLEFDGARGKTEGENLALFGLPVSPLQSEQLSDGRQYQVQYFERARFELHPENQPPYNVLLGLLGNEIRTGGSGNAPTPVPAGPTATPGPTPSPTPDAAAAGVPRELELYPPDPQRRPACDDDDGSIELRKLTPGAQNVDLSNGFIIKAPIDLPICLDDFRANSRVRVEVTRPDGDKRAEQVRVGRNGEAAVYFNIEPDDDLGLFNVVATGENGETASGNVQVIDTDQDDERIVPIPRTVEQDEVTRIYLAGFEPDRNVRLHIYRLDDDGKGTYVGSLPSLRTDDDGNASIRLGTGGYAVGAYAVGRFVDDELDPFQVFVVEEND